MIHMGNMTCRRLKCEDKTFVGLNTNHTRTGNGKRRRFAAIRSPGDSNVTDGIPKVNATNEASAPPSECPRTRLGKSHLLKELLLYRLSI